MPHRVSPSLTLTLAMTLTLTLTLTLTATLSLTATLTLTVTLTRTLTLTQTLIAHTGGQGQRQHEGRGWSQAHLALLQRQGTMRDARSVYEAG